MATKQVKLTMQVAPTTGSAADLVVLIDGDVKFNASVPGLGPAEQGTTDPVETVEFDIEVSSAQGLSNVADIFTKETHNFSATANNGRIKIETINVNFNPELTSNVGNLLANVVSSGANGFSTCNIVTQPLWNGEPDLVRYDIRHNNGPEQITGPGEVLIQPGETVTFDISVPLYY